MPENCVPPSYDKDEEVALEECIFLLHGACVEYVEFEAPPAEREMGELREACERLQTHIRKVSS